jgi:hypothetical protein
MLEYTFFYVNLISDYTSGFKPRIRSVSLCSFTEVDVELPSFTVLIDPICDRQ